MLQRLLLLGLLGMYKRPDTDSNMRHRHMPRNADAHVQRMQVGFLGRMFYRRQLVRQLRILLKWNMHEPRCVLVGSACTDANPVMRQVQQRNADQDMSVQLPMEFMEYVHRRDRLRSWDSGIQGL